MTAPLAFLLLHLLQETPKVHFVYGQFIHLPVVFHVRHTGVREIYCVAYLTVRAVQGYHTYIMTEIALRGAIFAPVETSCDNAAAKSPVELYDSLFSICFRFAENLLKFC